ncbi:MAG: hypothetical protein VYD64_08185 [Pseudomonadota bacterium]|nr:hypothetical protein [Pseudomonadota bacterium]
MAEVANELLRAALKSTQDRLGDRDDGARNEKRPELVGEAAE